MNSAGVCPRSLISFIELSFLHLIFKALFIKLGVKGVEVLFIKLVGEDSEVLAEALIVHNLTLSEKAYNVLDVGVIRKAQDVVISRARLLFWGTV